MPQVRVFYTSPQGLPVATCNVVVHPSPSLNGLGPKELDALLARTSDSDWVSLLGGKGITLEILQSRTVDVGKRSARRTTIDASFSAAPIFIRYTAVMLLRPGAIWTLVCGGGGGNWQEARDSYAYWEDTFNRIVDSVGFEE